MDSRRKTPKSDRYLVTEQPGMAVLLTGLIFSFIFGYTFKSYLSPARVSSHVEKAASHIHKDVQVNFDTAQLSLSDGLFPRFAVIITEVRLESVNKCWAAPVLEVDELRLPLSLWSLFRGEPPVRNLEADKVTLTLREDLQGCDRNENLENEKKRSASIPLVSLSPSQKEIKYQNELRSITIGEFHIVADKYPQISSDLMQFTVNVKSFEPKVIEVRAKTHLLKDQQVGDYLSHANLFVQYQESPQVKVQSHFFGNWREGHYSLIANYTLDEHLLAIEADLKHIPLSQILTILQKYNLASKELNGRQAWISTKARLVAPLDQLRQSPLEVRDLRLEGDLGELKAEYINVSSIEPLKFSPIVVAIKKLDIAKLLFLLNRPKGSSMLGELGFFSGQAEIQSDQVMKMSGEHSGLEFVFSNKGQRELQVVDRMVGDIDLRGDQWNFSVKRVEPRGGVFIGEVKLTADRDFHTVAMKTRVDELLLAPAVQKLMTNGGNIGALSLDVDLQVKDGILGYLKGLARLDGMTVEGLSFGKTKAAIDWSHGEVILNTQSKSLTVAPSSVGAPLLKQVTLPSWWTEDALAMNSLTGVFATKDLKVFSWKNVQGHVGKGGRFVTDGSWDEAGLLKGSVHSHEAKKHKKWVIEGDRENPTFAEESPAAKQLKR